MQNPTFRPIIVILLLLIGSFAVYAPRWLNASLYQLASQANRFLYVTDIDYWQRTEREQLVYATFAFDLAHNLNKLPLTLGTWQGEDKPQTNEDVLIMLDPSQYVRRLYQNDSGHYIWLSLIGGHGSRTFHPPEMCYDAHEWHTVLTSQSLTLDEGGQLYGWWLEAQKKSAEGEPMSEQVNFYFYLFPDHARDAADGIVIFKLTSPRYGTVEETLALYGDFIDQLFKRTEPLGGL